MPITYNLSPNTIKQQMMNHYNEQTIELYVLNAPEVEKQRDDIAAHLETCAGCREMYSELAVYYADVEQELTTETAHEPAYLPVPMRVPLPLELKYKDHPIRKQIELMMPLRIARWMFQHPYMTAGGAVTSFGLVIALALMMVNPALKISDNNPSYARAKEEFLIVYNKSGQELWRKHVGIGYDWDVARQLRVRGKLENYVTTLDVDNDGRQEVLSTFLWSPDDSLKKTLICYNYDGTERWKYTQTEKPIFGKEQFKTNFVIHRIIAADLDHDGKNDLYALALQEPYSPSVLARLNPDNGTEISKYWHTGATQYLLHKDVDNDGIEEIFLAGENNGLQRATLAVLDPRAISGYCPTDEGHRPQGMSCGTEKYYLIFPRTDLAKFSRIQRNSIHSIHSVAGGIEIQVVENLPDDKSYGPIFQFDNSLRCVGITEEDMFATLHRKFEAEGKLAQKLDAQYYEDLRRAVQYWDGEKFVTTPTINRKYIEALAKLKQES